MKIKTFSIITKSSKIILDIISKMNININPFNSSYININCKFIVIPIVANSRGIDVYTKILAKNNQCWVHNYFIHWSQKKVSNVFSMLVYLIQKMCNYLTLLAKANMAKVIITKQCIARLITCFSVYAGHLISSNSKIAAKEINLPLKNNTGKPFFILKTR